MGQLSAWQLSRWIDELDNVALYATLFTADPNAASDPLTVEVLGSGFSRVLAYFTRSGASLLTLDQNLVLQGIPPGTTVVWIGFMDASSNGHLIASDFTRNPETGETMPWPFPTGGIFIVPAGEFVIGIDSLGSGPPPLS